MHNYVHTVTIDDVHHTRFFSLFDMSEDHLTCLQLLLSNQPVPTALIEPMTDIKQAVDYFRNEAAKVFPGQTPVERIANAEVMQPDESTPPTAPAG